jgi:hypothetical protein
MPVPRPLTALLLLAGCSGPGDAGFTLTLSPRFIDGQDVLGPGPEVELYVHRPDGPLEVTSLGTASSGGELTLPEVEPFEIGTVLGLHALVSGDSYAYGQTVLADPSVDAIELLVPKVGAVGEIGQLAANRQRFGAAAAIIPGGDVYLFGGHEPVGVDLSEGPDTIFVLRGATIDAGGDSVEQLPEPLPKGETYTGAVTRARVAASATPVMVDGALRILLTGGRPTWQELEPIDDWHLFDPATGLFVDEGKMDAPHSSHLAVPFASGEILLYAGLSSPGWPQPMPYDIWNPDSQKSKGGAERLELETGAIHVLGSAYDQDVVVCGGINDVGDLNHFVWVVDSGCNRIRSDGAVDTFDELPVPLAGAAMAEVGDGLLVTGGWSETVTDDLAPTVLYRSTPALDTSWLYTPSAGWQPVGPLKHARAHHRMLPLADGRVLVVGGTTMGNGFHGPLTDAVTCPELYDPTTGLFTEVDCAEVSGGADPLVAAWPGEGAFVYEGFTRDGAIYDGVARYGLVATGPPLEP